jgi:hypothetical protein
MTESEKSSEKTPETPERREETSPPPESLGGPPPTASAAMLVTTCVSLLAARAWEAMGLIPNSTTKQIEKDFDDAQLAIDAAAALAELLRPRVTDSDRREIETLLTNLRLNFVEQKRKAT